LRTNVRQGCEEVLLPPLGSLSCGQYARTARGETKIPNRHARLDTIEVEICNLPGNLRYGWIPNEKTNRTHNSAKRIAFSATL
jgi:hypothetical protein